MFEILRGFIPFQGIVPPQPPPIPCTYDQDHYNLLLFLIISSCPNILQIFSQPSLIPTAPVISTHFYRNPFQKNRKSQVFCQNLILIWIDLFDNCIGRSQHSQSRNLTCRAEKSGPDCFVVRGLSILAFSNNFKSLLL